MKVIARAGREPETLLLSLSLNTCYLEQESTKKWCVGLYASLAIILSNCITCKPKKNEKTFKYLICNNLSKLIIFRVYKHSSFELQCQAFIICTANHTSLISSLHISTQLYIVLGVLHSCPQFVVPAC